VHTLTKVDHAYLSQQLPDAEISCSGFLQFSTCPLIVGFLPQQLIPLYICIGTWQCQKEVNKFPDFAPDHPQDLICFLYKKAYSLETFTKVSSITS